MTNCIRVRFAPSPTGGLHVGGVRTALFNYLFAKKYGGTSILRIEDTDQTRFVPRAEKYIYETLEWCGIVPDESPIHGGAFGPYKQSERKKIYEIYAHELVEKGFAYYAFDTPQELEQMRLTYKTDSNPSPQYNTSVRGSMKNSLTLTSAETNALLDSKTPYVIRIKMPENEVVSLQDLIRGEVSFNTALLDDKVLFKADGMPTYHLPVVVDDYLMKISHVFRGEEWLPSTPIHLLLWKYLGWESVMPQWAHLPLLLKPDGHGKLSKRDGERLGFPVFAMDWLDPYTGELTKGYKERGFLPAAFINMLALLGWNNGSEEEILTLESLIKEFSIERVHKGGAKFDYEKAKWFNATWIKKMSATDLLPYVKNILANLITTKYSDTYIQAVIHLTKDRCVLAEDIKQQMSYFFIPPVFNDLSGIQQKWSESKSIFFDQLCLNFAQSNSWTSNAIEGIFLEGCAIQQIKSGEVLLPFRIMLVGGKFGPSVFEIANLIGKEACIERIKRVTSSLLH